MSASPHPVGVFDASLLPRWTVARAGERGGCRYADGLGELSRERHWHVEVPPIRTRPEWSWSVSDQGSLHDAPLTILLKPKNAAVRLGGPLPSDALGFGTIPKIERGNVRIGRLRAIRCHAPQSETLLLVVNDDIALARSHSSFGGPPVLRQVSIADRDHVLVVLCGGGVCTSFREVHDPFVAYHFAVHATPSHVCDMCGHLSFSHHSTVDRYKCVHCSCRLVPARSWDRSQHATHNVRMVD